MAQMDLGKRELRPPSELRVSKRLTKDGGRPAAGRGRRTNGGLGGRRTSDGLKERKGSVGTVAEDA
jgi:hypothetical protein